MREIDYYRIKNKDNSFLYLAVSRLGFVGHSSGTVARFLGEESNPLSFISLCGYRRNTLEFVTIEEAEKASGFEAFKKSNFEVCNDGVFYLGGVN